MNEMCWRGREGGHRGFPSIPSLLPSQAFLSIHQYHPNASRGSLWSSGGRDWPLSLHPPVLTSHACPLGWWCKLCPPARQLQARQEDPNFSTHFSLPYHSLGHFSPSYKHVHTHAYAHTYAHTRIYMYACTRAHTWIYFNTATCLWV